MGTKISQRPKDVSSRCLQTLFGVVFTLERNHRKCLLDARVTMQMHVGRRSDGGQNVLLVWKALSSCPFGELDRITPPLGSSLSVSFNKSASGCDGASVNVFPSSSGAQEYIYYLWAKALRRAKDKIIFLGCQLPLMSSKQINIHDLELLLVWVTEYRYDFVRVMWLPVKPKFIL